MVSASHQSEPLIRRIRQDDNAAVGGIIREVMTEFGAVGCEFSIADPEVDAMYEAYPTPGAAFYVVELDGQVVRGCCGAFWPRRARPDTGAATWKHSAT
jgi:hypothetical protein